MVWTHIKTALQSGDETTWGTEVTTNTVIGTVKSYTPDSRWDIYEVRGAGDGREAQNFVKTRFSCRPTIVYEVHEFSFLKHAIGPRDGDGSTGDPYTLTEADYTGTTADTNIIPASIECGSVGSSDDVDTYTGCFIDSFTLDATLGGVLTCTANLICKSVTSSTSATAYTPPTTHPWVMTSEGTFKWGDTPSSVSGVRSVSITYNNNMIVYGDWNTIFISMPIAGERNITWSATVVMSSTVATTLRDDFYGQANSPVDDEGEAEPEADKELHLIFSQGSSSGDKKAEIYLDQCMIESISKPITMGTGDVVLVTFSGRAKTSGKTGASNVFAKWWTVT